MQNSLPTVTVGIPAYNEAGNIGFLIEDILMQKTSGFRLERIVIVSDGSSDATVAVARSYRDDRIEVVDSRERKGKAERQNEIFETVGSDILVMLDADVLLYRYDFLEELVAPILSDGVDLVAAKIEPLQPRTLVERSLCASVFMKNIAFGKLRDGRNIFTCAGAGRAFSRRLYSATRFSESVGEDAYCYLYAASHGFKYAFASRAVLGIRLPNNLRDHMKQSFRYMDSQGRFEAEFGAEYVRSEYVLPKTILLRAAADTFLLKPFPLIFYALLMGWLFLRSMFRLVQTTNAWEIAGSSKTVRSS